MIPDTHTNKDCKMKNEYFMGCDVSKGYADFIILDKSKRCIEHAFQLDDTFACTSRTRRWPRRQAQGGIASASCHRPTRRALASLTAD